MQKIEFEQRTGIELTDEQYQRVENMYLNAGNMDKDEFCEDYKKHSDSVILNTYFDQSEKLRNKLDAYREQQINMAYFLIKKSMVGGDKDMVQMAISLIGEQKYIQHKLERGYNLFESDKELIISLINK
jgi:hypothetical protein|nr:MAG TPA: hypothetical protein [Caudoviricetes sp.]